MSRPRLTPVSRISLSLVLFTLSLLLISELLGLIPDGTKDKLAARKKVCESLAVQLSSAAEKDDLPLIESTLQAMVARNSDILSAALRSGNSDLMAEVGDHQGNWQQELGGRSTPTQVQVPIFFGEQLWGNVELRFVALQPTTPLEYLGKSLIGLFLFVTCSGFLGYRFLMRRTLRELDPATVIPKRVKAAFDALSEGVLILDEHERIVLANSAFAEKLEQHPNSLQGYKASELNFRDWKTGDAIERYPWQRAMDEGSRETGVFLTMQSDTDIQRTFVVNGTPILDDEGNKRGALVTFDDMTVLEQKNDELSSTLSQLEKTQEEISRQNEELKLLATSDPLTGCLNRRSFFERFDLVLADAVSNSTELSCIMADIDHFKSINDRYGHATGDKVIKVVASILQTKSRDEDVVGRYGGEEFCIFLPGLDIAEAAEVGERLRREIHQGPDARFTSGVRITASFGVASLSCGAKNPGDLTNLADQALYVAKESGRNRVIRCDNTEVAKPPSLSATADKVQEADKSLEGLEAQDTTASEDSATLKKHIEELERKLEERSRELEFQASHDSLTGLPNRVLFSDRVKQALVRARRFHTIVGVLSLDIDMFKRVNDTLGHIAGDRLLNEAGHRLVEILREGDTIALFGDQNPSPTVSRLGNDEFGILLSEVDDVESITWIVKRLVDTLSECMEIEAHEFYITSSIGISIYPYDGETPEALLQNAGAARHHAKKQIGRNSWQYYAKDINETSLERIQLESQLRHAIEYGEFELFYQPRIELTGRRIVGMEALIRWRHPDRGLISPAEFIPVAEHTGLILPIGDWVLRTAVRQLKTWLDQGYAGLSIAVNLSTMQLRQADIAELIFGVLDEYGVDPKHLELEVTETVMMDNMALAVDSLKSLHANGISVAIDDFGTGYSSLNYLKHFPVDTLKIDRSFVPDIARDSNDAAIVAGIIAMAHSMDLNVVAEGIETKEQEELVRQLGCDELQGFLISRPVPLPEATALLESNQVITDRASMDEVATGKLVWLAKEG